MDRLRCGGIRWGRRKGRKTINVWQWGWCPNGSTGVIPSGTASFALNTGSNCLIATGSHGEIEQWVMISGFTDLPLTLCAAGGGVCGCELVGTFEFPHEQRPSAPTIRVVTQNRSFSANCPALGSARVSCQAQVEEAYNLITFFCSGNSNRIRKAFGALHPATS